MADGPPHAVRCLKNDDGPSGVWLVQRPGEVLRTLKLWPAVPGTLVKLALRIAQPQRQIRGAALLERSGVLTPAIVGSWRLARYGGRRWVQLEMSYIEGRSAFELLQAGAEAGEAVRRCARPIGRAVGAIANAGLLHRDLKLRNVIVEEGTDPPRVWIIDPVGVRRMNDRPLAFLRMLDRLVVEAVHEGVRLPRDVWQPALRAALTGQTRIVRRVVCGLMREHLRQRYGQSRRGSETDPPPTLAEETARPE